MLPPERACWPPESLKVQPRGAVETEPTLLLTHRGFLLPTHSLSAPPQPPGTSSVCRVSGGEERANLGLEALGPGSHGIATLHSFVNPVDIGVYYVLSSVLGIRDKKMNSTCVR